MLVTNKDVLNGAREFELTENQFQIVKQKIKKLAGVSLSDNKENMVYSRLSRRMRELRISSFHEYLRRVDYNAKEEQAFVDALTTNLTSFFREPHHFEVLAKYLRQKQGTTRIWSAGCSSGEEAYSIAMTAANVCGSFTPKLSLHATDINTQVLKKAKQGTYNFDTISKVSGAFQKQFFQRGTGLNQGLVRVIPEIQSLVKFSRLNFMDKQYPLPMDLDIIFCRNALIYFDTPTTDIIIERMMSHLKPNGLLIVGHSENYSRFSPRLKLVSNTVYVKG